MVAWCLAETQMACGYGDKAASRPMQSDFAVQTNRSEPSRRAAGARLGDGRKRIMEALWCAQSALLVANSRPGLARRESLAPFLGAHATSRPWAGSSRSSLPIQAGHAGAVHGLRGALWQRHRGQSKSAFKRMVEAGMPVEKAVALAGLVAGG